MIEVTTKITSTAAAELSAAAARQGTTIEELAGRVLMVEAHLAKHLGGFIPKPLPPRILAELPDHT